MIVQYCKRSLIYFKITVTLFNHFPIYPVSKHFWRVYISYQQNNNMSTITLKHISSHNNQQVLRHHKQNKYPIKWKCTQSSTFLKASRTIYITSKIHQFFAARFQSHKIVSDVTCLDDRKEVIISLPLNVSETFFV